MAAAPTCKYIYILVQIHFAINKIKTNLLIAMSSIHRIYRDVQYNLDYYNVKYRQRLYSNDRNPRLIQTRLQNKTLLSLRTCPHDKYLIKPGEFLTIEPMDMQQEEDLEEELFCDFASPPASRRLDLNLLHSITMNSVSDLIKIEPEPEELQSEECSCACHSPISFKQRVKLKLIRLRPERVKELPQEEDTELEPFPVLRQMPCLLPSPPRITTGATFQPVLSKPNQCLNNSNCQCTKCCKSEENVWKKVLNDVSLSAARLSTGSLPTSRHDFENLTSDFIDAKSKDAFADCWNQAKHNYSDIILLYGNE